MRLHTLNTVCNRYAVEMYSKHLGDDYMKRTITIELNEQASKILDATLSQRQLTEIIEDALQEYADVTIQAAYDDEKRARETDEAFIL